MAWTDSRIFQQALLNPIMGRLWTTAVPTSFSSLSADTVNAALFGTGVTPDKTAAVGSTGFNTGTWTTGNELIDSGGTNWVSGGRALGTKTFGIDTGSSSVYFGAASTAGAGNVTITAAFGCLVYDFTISGGTVAKQGLCYNYFGGTQSVSGGSFTIVWATVGAVQAVFNFTV